MKTANLKYGVLSSLVSCIRIMMIFLPFHAFLTVFLSSNFGHYTVFRLWKEVLLAFCTIAVIYLIFFDVKVRFYTLSRRLAQLILAYIGLVLIMVIVALGGHQVTLKAAAYGALIDVRFLIFFLVCWATAIRTNRLSVKLESLVIRPALMVVSFGLLQIVALPKDFLRHFGYGMGQNTIAPFQTINSNSHYVRIESTLRGANDLGDYLLLVISTLLIMPIKKLTAKRIVRRSLLLAACALVLLFTFSRAAWVGAIIVVGIMLGSQITSKSLQKKVAIGAVVAGLILAGAFIGLRNNTVVQNLTLHTQKHSAVSTTSDAGHSSAIKNGLHDIVHQPFGRGPGTAGPASVYNDDKVRLPEDYYIQIGQETGILGMLLFITITVGVGALLWMRRADRLALALFASLLGLSFVNLLSPAWTDDTISYIWWGLAGIAMAPLAEVKSAAKIASKTKKQVVSKD